MTDPVTALALSMGAQVDLPGIDLPERRVVEMLCGVLQNAPKLRWDVLY